MTANPSPGSGNPRWDQNPGILNHLVDRGLNSYLLWFWVIACWKPENDAMTSMNPLIPEAFNPFHN